jgi:acetamidase/formamidase
MEHQIDADRVHHRWDNRLEPTLKIASGDTVHYDLRMAGHGQVVEHADATATVFDWDTLYNLLGPLWVDGARPGDTLRVDVLTLETGDWGWAAIIPGEGLLPDDFPDPVVRTFDLRERGSVEIAAGIRIPTAPFLGTMGTHPDDPVVAGAFPPHKGGGNVDTRHLTRGSTLWLPVWCEGALFSCGDPHAAQGDGEVCVTAIECDMRASLRFELERRTIGGPRFRAPGPLLAASEANGHIGTMGLSPDLMEGARLAVREMIALLVAEHGLGREDAYMLCSFAGDLKILEIVDSGVWNVGFTLPGSILAARPSAG